MPLKHEALTRLVIIIRNDLRELFDLKTDLDEIGTTEHIRRGAEFRGTNTWVLIFAIFIASIGLNVNSTAVVIGAMLISPLMGPILGAGLSLGTSDFEFLKKCAHNLVAATLVSLATSTIYFLISPLDVVQSELLARTQPTIYDVLIAAFGGAAGIVAATRKDRTSTVVPGVAIATALMPPLCTAGYSLANGEPRFFLGALYLFGINAIFICLSTMIGIKALGFRRVTSANEVFERKATLYVTLFAIAAIVPATYTGYQVVQDAVFHAKANRYLTDFFANVDAKVASQKLSRTKNGKVIDLTLVGHPLSEEQRRKLENGRVEYGLSDTKLIIHETGASIAEELEKRLGSNLRQTIIENLYSGMQANTSDLTSKVKALEDEVMRFRKYEAITDDAGRELMVLDNDIAAIWLGQLPHWVSAQSSTDAASSSKYGKLAVVEWKKQKNARTLQKFDQFLRVKVGDQQLLVIHRPRT